MTELRYLKLRLSNSIWNQQLYSKAKNFLSKNSNHMGKGKTKIHLENQGANRTNMNWCTHPRSGRVRYQTITINKTLYAPFTEADSISDLRLEAVLNIVSLDYMIRTYSWRHNVVMHGTCSVVQQMWNWWQREAEEGSPILCRHCPKGKRLKP